MKLNYDNYYDKEGNVDVSEAGWLELRDFCCSVVYKRVGNKQWNDDLISISLISCIEALERYDREKCNQLGGFLYFVVLGEISKAANRASKEIPWGTERDINIYGRDTEIQEY